MLYFDNLRFKEREEKVKADIFRAYQALLGQTKPSSNVNMTKFPNTMGAEEGQLPNIVNDLHREMKEKSIITRQGIYKVISFFCYLILGCHRMFLFIDRANFGPAWGPGHPHGAVDP